MRLDCPPSGNRWPVVLLLLALGLFGCGKPAPPAAPDPRTPEGTLVQLLDQGRLLKEALARQDYNYLHDFGFHFKSLAQAFLGKMEEAQRQQMRDQVLRLINLAGELDRAAGGTRTDATVATVEKLIAALQETDRLYRETKKGN